MLGHRRRKQRLLFGDRNRLTSLCGLFLGTTSWLNLLAHLDTSFKKYFKGVLQSLIGWGSRYRASFLIKSCWHLLLLLFRSPLRFHRLWISIRRATIWIEQWNICRPRLMIAWESMNQVSELRLEIQSGRQSVRVIGFMTAVARAAADLLLNDASACRWWKKVVFVYLRDRLV